MKKTYIILWITFSLFLTWCGIDSLIMQDESSDKNINIEDPIENNEEVTEENNTLLYENKEHNFSFELPNERTFEENKYGFKTIVFSPKDDEIKENVWISVQQLQKFLSVQEYYEETINKLKKTIKTFTETKTEDIKIWNLKWKTIWYEYKEWDIIVKSKETFLMSAENKVYIINYTATKDTFEKFLEWAETILNTFKVAK